MPKRWDFTLVPGFLCDYSHPSAQNANGKAISQPGLGLLPRSYPSDTDVDHSAHADEYDLEGAEKKTNDSSSTEVDGRSWPRFMRYVARMNREAPEGTKYKVVFLTRHGVGYHNVKQGEVGTEAWDAKWSLMDGDENSTWFDAFLTDKGTQQARQLSTLWLQTIQQEGMPVPSVIYTSPLARCLQTTEIVFGPLLQSLSTSSSQSSSHSATSKSYSESKTQIPPIIIKENIRERYTLHTCDIRRTATWIKEHYPTYIFEDGFAEEDPFFAKRGQHTRETAQEHKARKQKVLARLFDQEPLLLEQPQNQDTEGGQAKNGSCKSARGGQLVAMTMHHGAIHAVLMACGVEQFKVREGSTIGLFIKGVKTGAE